MDLLSCAVLTAGTGGAVRGSCPGGQHHSCEPEACSCLPNTGPNRARAAQKGSLADSSASTTARPGCSSQPSWLDEDKMQEASALCSIQSNLLLSEKTSHSLPYGHTHVPPSTHGWMRDQTSSGYVSFPLVPTHPSTEEL